MDPADAVASFCAVTGAGEAAALQMLEATNYDVQAAIDLHFASGAEGGADADMPPLEDDEALARRLQQEAQGGPAGPAGPTGPGPMQEEEVRAPLPVRTERLYGDEAYRPPAPRRPANPVPPNVVDAFRDFRAEGGVGGAPGGGGGGASLAAMFEPPREMLFQGSFEEAKQHAQEQGRWLIINLQSTSQFASHQLNRDTWHNDMVRSLVEANFVLFQAYDVVEEGQKLLHFYKVFELPATLIIDPVTGAPMWQRTGFIDADRLTEELLPFLDHSIHDPSAARLARRNRSRRDLQRQASGASSKPLTEEEELQRALEMSMAEAGGGGGGAAAAWGGSGAGTSDMGEAAEEEEEGEEEGAGGEGEVQRPAAEVQAEAGARLPAEPADGSGCRIAVRLPDGRRVTRRFPPAAAVAAVYDLCLAESEEAAGGRPFLLAQPMPGAAALEDRGQSVEAAHLGGAMLVLKWQD